MMRIKLFLVCFGVLLAHTPTLYSFDLTGSSFFLPRSDSTNSARLNAGWHRYRTPENPENVHVTFSATPEYSRTFRSSRIAEYFFGTNSLTVSGSMVGDRCENDLLADYFGLSPEFSSTTIIKPIAQQFTVDFALLASKGCWYFLVHSPIVHKTTRIETEEKTHSNSQNTPFPAKYMSENEVTAPVQTFSNALRSSFNFGDVRAREFGNIYCTNQDTFDLADVHFVLGWDVVKRRRGHAGFNLQVVAPTGTRSTARFLFEPIVGNGRHWEFGAGFTGHALVWEKDGEQELNIVADVNITHLFKSRQCRSFDLCANGFGSRYILLKEFNADGDYTRTTVPAINITTRPVDVSIAIQLDFSIFASYNYKSLSFDIGYNGWLRSHEKLSCPEPIKRNTYGLKGIQDVIALVPPSNATESGTTLHGEPFSEQALLADPLSPVFISTADLNLESGATPLSFTHKIFWNLNYAFEDYRCLRITPYCGCGGEVEFEGVRPRDVSPNKNSLAQWGLWIKSGFAY